MIYFIRHGATDWNENINADGKKDPKCQGRADLSLNKKGIQQAELAAETLKNIKFDRVICSPLMRAVQTCEIVCGSLDNVIFDERVIERNFGEFEGLTRSEFDFNGFWNLNSNQNFKSAETLQELKTRVFSLLDELKHNPNENVLIVSHGGVGGLFISYFDGEPKDGNYLSFELPNGKPIVKDFNAKSFK